MIRENCLPSCVVLATRERFAACFLFLVSRPVRQALALNTTQSIRRPVPIANAKAGPGPVVIAEFSHQWRAAAELNDRFYLQDLHPRSAGLLHLGPAARP